jgi:3-hydroxymyristoyl/3-hydroxydecanoyl-(acyl carrier protein) dehydratase
MKEITAHSVVLNDHPSLPGHFPDRPIVPGVVLLDLVLKAIRSASSPPLKLEAIVSTKFLQAVAPEARIDMQIKLAPENDPARFRARFVCSHAAATVAEGSLLLSVEEFVTEDLGGKA